MSTEQIEIPPQKKWMFLKLNLEKSNNNEYSYAKNEERNA